MPRGVHAKDQTAFRFPPGVLPRLKERAEAEGRTMTDIVTGLVTGYLDGITTSAAPAESVSPPRAQKSREVIAPAARIIAAEDARPAPRRHAVNCKCGTCRPKNGDK